eukprot:1146872-Pelagomonas_calceolata.AAC.8
MERAQGRGQREYGNGNVRNWEAKGSIGKGMCATGMCKGKDKGNVAKGLSETRRQKAHRSKVSHNSACLPLDHCNTSRSHVLGRVPPDPH